MGNIYAIANRKGGCSKTTTTGALGAGLVLKGKKVLCVDMDPQADLTFWSGIDPTDRPTVFEVVGGKRSASEAIIHLDRYDLLPGDISLTLAQTVAPKESGSATLAQCLSEVAKDYDFILIDTPPSLDFLTISALVAADGGVIVPTDTGTFATRGLKELNDLIERIQSEANPKIRISGVLITRFSSAQNASKMGAELTKRFSQFLDAPLYNRTIRYSVDIPLAIQECRSLYDIPRKNVGVADYKLFVDEFLEREGEMVGHE